MRSFEYLKNYKRFQRMESEQKNYKPEREIEINQEQHQILIGILLGDGHLELAPNKKAARLRFSQTAKRDFYVNHLHKKFKNWNCSSVREHVKEKGIMFEFDSAYTPTLLKYHKLFYDDNKEKRIPHLDNEFTSRSFAYLFMDDGGLKSKEAKSVYINTYDLPEKDQRSFCKLLEEKFLLKAKIVFDRGEPRIFISGESYEIFKYLLSPHLLSGFEHKVPTPRSEVSRFHRKVPDQVIERRIEEEQIDLKELIDFNELPFFQIPKDREQG